MIFSAACLVMTCETVEAQHQTEEGKLSGFAVPGRLVVRWEPAPQEELLGLLIETECLSDTRPCASRQKLLCEAQKLWRCAEKGR